jgi:MarR family transcriptional regulator, 2-MHQ and catechol-resistance regulon repressor
MKDVKQAARRHSEDSPETTLADSGGAPSAKRFLRRFPTADWLAIETHMALSQAFVTINQALRRYSAPQGFDLIRAQHNFLAVLFVSEENQLSLSDIAREMGVSPPYVTKLLDDFEADGLVERVYSQSDRRITYARLTAQGEERCAAIVPGFVSFIEGVGQALTSAEKAELTRLLRKYASGVTLLEGG